MELHDPKNLKLPALKIGKKVDRDLIEKDIAVKNLIDSKLLLNKNLNQLLTSFLGKTKDINKFLEKRNEYNRLRFTFHSHHPSRFLEWSLMRKLKKRYKGTKTRNKNRIKETII